MSQEKKKREKTREEHFGRTIMNKQGDRYGTGARGRGKETYCYDLRGRHRLGPFGRGDSRKEETITSVL